jgi:hypothetical protein
MFLGVGGDIGQSVMLSTHFHLISRVRIFEAVRMFALMVWTGTLTFLIRLLCVSKHKTTLQIKGAHGSAVGGGTTLQAGRLRVRFPDGVIGIFHWHNPSGRTVALGLTRPLTEMSTRNIFWGQRWPVPRADNLTTFMCRLSWNLGASLSWNRQGLSRPVIGVLYLYLTFK